MLKVTLLSLIKILSLHKRLYVVTVEKTRSGREIIQFISSKNNDIRCYTTLLTSIDYCELLELKNKVEEGFLVIAQYDVQECQIASCTHEIHNLIKKFIDNMCKKQKNIQHDV